MQQAPYKERKFPENDQGILPDPCECGSFTDTHAELRDEVAQDAGKNADETLVDRTFADPAGAEYNNDSFTA